MESKMNGQKNTYIKYIAFLAMVVAASVLVAKRNEIQFEESPLLRHRSLRVMNRLELVHITKTGGSSVEAAAAKAGVIWGVCHFLKIEEVGCMQPDIKGYRQAVAPGTGITHTTPWHLPPRYDLNHPTYLDGAKTFAIIRNPYTRVVSEYYCPWFGYKGDDINNPEHLNEFIQTYTKTAGTDIHFMQQFKYIFNEDGERTVDHLVRFENMSEEFPALMKQYGYEDIKLSHINGAKGHGKHLGLKDLNDRTIELINKHYENDFVLFGYKMVKNQEEMVQLENAKQLTS